MLLRVQGWVEERGANDGGGGGAGSSCLGPGAGGELIGRLSHVTCDLQGCA